jgi:glycosyltransferase involved in cell wall biosynthesis
LLITDAQWRGTLKQLGGILVSPILVHPTTDYVFVPGDRQARFMRFLGFGRERIIWPCLTGDTALFEPVAERPLHERKAFPVVARLHPRKGIDVLLEAYRRYRATTDAPWPLIMCGTGPLAERVQAEPGVEAVGFVQPGDLPQQFSRAACFVLPSMYEPYAVAAHEAVIAGLGLICSQAVGAGDNFVDLAGDNGAVVPTGDAAALAQALEDVARRSDDELETMRRRSIELAHRITPEIWADAVAGAVTDFEATAARRGRPASSRRD